MQFVNTTQASQTTVNYTDKIAYKPDGTIVPMRERVVKSARSMKATVTGAIGEHHRLNLCCHHL